MARLRAIDFYGRRRTWYTFSLAMIVVGAIFLALPGFGLRLGIDFVGGSILEARFVRTDITTTEVRSVLTPLGFGEPMVQAAADDPGLFLIRTKTFEDTARATVEAALRASLGDFTVLRFEGIAGVIGAELAARAVLAVAIAAGLMLLYITVRFEFRFAVAAVVALLHDVLITVAAFSVLQREVNASFIAALLTVVGYSINDTIVVFDRIRENLRARAYGPGEFGGLVNRSIRETLTRSVNTSATTLLAIGAVFLLGGRTTRDFALALMIGIATGTYSSIFIASPIWATWRERAFASLRPVKKVAETEPAPSAPARSERAQGPLAGGAKDSDRVDAGRSRVPADGTARTAPQGRPARARRSKRR